MKCIIRILLLSSLAFQLRAQALLVPEGQVGDSGNSNVEIESPGVLAVNTIDDNISPDNAIRVISHWWPQNDNERNLGSSVLRWRNLWLSENALISGNVGVGTNTPEARFHIHETTPLGNTTGNYQLLSRSSGLVGPNTVKRNLWLLRDEAGTGWSYSRLHDGISVDVSYNIPGSDSRTWWERDPKDNIQSWGNGGSAYMTLKSGNLGIGTDTPSERLEVKGKVRFSVNSSGQAPANVEGLFVENNGSSHTFYVFQTATVGGGKSFTITNSGRVGIGTTLPDEKLTVKGTVHAEEVKVDLNAPGPDYVFEKDYDLLSLSEVESYINEHKHLPEMPSAKEMEANGLNLKEMNLLLLKKVEELTLHLIEQNKINEAQTRANALLLQKLEDLINKN